MTDKEKIEKIREILKHTDFSESYASDALIAGQLWALLEIKEIIEGIEN